MVSGSSGSSLVADTVVTGSEKNFDSLSGEMFLGAFISAIFGDLRGYPPSPLISGIISLAGN